MRFKIPKGYEEYCESTPFTPSNDPEIIKMAEELTKEKKTPTGASEAIFEWVRDEIAWDILPIVGFKKTLDRKPRKGICIDKVNVLIALLRSLGIPARYVAVLGAELEFKVKLPPCPHMYAEVFLNGEWVDVDPSFGYHEQKMISPSEFGKRRWIKGKKVDKFPNLTDEFIKFANDTQKKDPNAKIYKEIINKLSVK